MAKKIDIDKLLKDEPELVFTKAGIKTLGNLIKDWFDFGFFNKAKLTTIGDKTVIILE